MEGVLERAVANGADNLLRQVKHVMPDVPMLTGAPAVRGFRLDDYGVFFDVEVPALRLPLAWTLRYVVDGNRLAVNAALAQLRAMVLQQPPQERARLEVMVRQMEERNMPESTSSQVDPAVVRDPNEAYTRAVKEALVDAMLESSGPLNLGPDEWLTVGRSRQRAQRPAGAGRLDGSQERDLQGQGQRPGGVPVGSDHARAGRAAREAEEN
jgi:hypothetical protein